MGALPPAHMQGLDVVWLPILALQVDKTDRVMLSESTRTSPAFRALAVKPWPEKANPKTTASLALNSCRVRVGEFLPAVVASEGSRQGWPPPLQAVAL